MHVAGLGDKALNLFATPPDSHSHLGRWRIPLVKTGSTAQRQIQPQKQVSRKVCMRQITHQALYIIVTEPFL